MPARSYRSSEALAGPDQMRPARWAIFAGCSGASRCGSSPCSLRCAWLRPASRLLPTLRSRRSGMQVGSEEWSFQSHQGMVDLWRAIARGPAPSLTSAARADREATEDGGMTGPQSNNGIGTYQGSGWHGDGQIKPLACLQHAEAEDQSLRIAATTICLGLMRPALFRRATRAATAGLKRIADSAGM